MILGDKLKALRTAKKMSQKELAERIADCIYNYLTGKINDSKAFLEVKPRKFDIYE